MSDPIEQRARECALEVAITCDKFSERDGCRITDRLVPIIAAMREVCEQNDREIARLQMELDATVCAEQHRQVVAEATRLAAEVERLNNDHVAINAERAETRDIRKEMIRAQDEVASLRALLTVAEGALKWWQELKQESRGVAGYHMNGDVAEWDELNDPTAEVLAKIAATKSSDSPKNS